MRSKGRILTSIATAALLVASFATGASADWLATDGDSMAVNGAGEPLNFGNVCPGATMTSGGVDQVASLYMVRGREPMSISTPVLANGATVDMHVGSIVKNGLNSTISTTEPTDVTLPTNWTSLLTGATSPVSNPTVTLVAGTTLGADSATIDYHAGPVATTTGSMHYSRTFTVMWTVVSCDTTPPVITPTVTGTQGLNGWYTSDVNVSWNVVELDSAITSSTGCGPVTISEDTTGTTLTCSATSGGGTSSKSVTIKRDATVPNVSLVGGPADGASYDFGSVPAAPTCTAEDTTSGVDDAGCTVTGYSTAVGTHTVTAASSDRAGLEGSTSHTYTVAPWALNGFYRPVDMNGVLNTVKGGSTVPLKFEVFQGTTELTDVAAIQSFSAKQVVCDSGVPTDAIEEFATTGGTALRYDTTAGQFIQNWKTPTTAGKCYLVTMTTDDGTALTALFKIK